MFDKEFLKTLTIMYVEDDESIRGSLGTMLKKIFGEVIICIDGNEGVQQFKHYTQDKNKQINAIVSDINMPNLNGIDMAKEIRELDTEIPIIYTTAHGESNYLMEAIKLKIAYYALKPINITELIQTISKICAVEHNKKLISKKEQQLTQYIKIMDQITTNFKVDRQGNIIEANEMLAEISEYTKEELLLMNIDKILHQDAVIKSHKDIVDLIGNKSEYKGKIKFISKSGNTFYLNTTVMPSYNDATSALTGAVYIGLDQTSDELEKQQTMQRVRKNILEQRGKESSYTARIKQLEQELEKYSTLPVSVKDAEFMKNALSKERQKVASLNSQVEHYEYELKNVSSQRNYAIEDERNKKTELMKKIKDLNRENGNLQSKVIELQALVARLEAQKRGKTVE
ncbi:MAG: response regulator [Campylobacterota bacterium]|nr:response regulator [Campylobacterota bacterium]